MADLKLCNNCRTVTTCIELGCGQEQSAHRAAPSSPVADDGLPKGWAERMPEHVRQIGTAASEAGYKDAEIADWRAWAARRTTPQPPKEKP